MVSPVPKHLRCEHEYDAIAPDLRNHVVDLAVNPANGKRVPNAALHRAKYAPGFATELVKLATTGSIGDPTLALNDIDLGMAFFLEPLKSEGCEVTYLPVTEISWFRDTCIFSPPYYPRTDRRRPGAHNDRKRGPVVGFRDAYPCEHPDFIGNPGGVGAIRRYREQMTAVFKHLLAVCNRMIVATKNWTRLGVEMRLDLDVILMAQLVGWQCVERHGWYPPQSLWSRFNARRGGGVLVEDVLIFEQVRP